MQDFFDNEYVRKAKELFIKISSMSIFQRTPSRKVLIIGFLCIIGVLLIASGASWIKQGINKDNETTADVSETQSMPEAVLPQSQLDSNCLFVLTDNDKQKISALILVRLDSLNDSIKISFIDPSTKQNVGNHNTTMHKHLKNGGVSELVWAVSEKYKISIERYLLGDEAAFVKLMNGFGNIEIENDKKISHKHNGVSFIIDKGLQTLTPDMMLKYFLYLSDTIENNKDKAVKAMMIYAYKIFSADASDSALAFPDEDKLKESFESKLGYFETDISALDYTRYKDSMRSLSSGDLISKVTIVEDPAFFSILNNTTN